MPTILAARARINVKCLAKKRVRNFPTSFAVFHPILSDARHSPPPLLLPTFLASLLVDDFVIWSRYSKIWSLTRNGTERSKPERGTSKEFKFRERKRGRESSESRRFIAKYSRLLFENERSKGTVKSFLFGGDTRRDQNRGLKTLMADTYRRVIGSWQLLISTTFFFFFFFTILREKDEFPAVGRSERRIVKFVFVSFRILSRFVHFFRVFVKARVKRWQACRPRVDRTFYRVSTRIQFYRDSRNSFRT